MSVKFPFFWGGGGGSADFIFMGARIFLIDGQNRQSPIASVQRTRSTLASHSAVPCGTNVNRAIRIAAQRTQSL